jgi:hypothetical protein
LERFLAGFTTAEGHFGATEKGHPTFVINLRVDDRHVLDCLSTELDVGYVRVRRAYRSRIGIHVNPLASWCVTHWPHLRRLASVFERCPPRGRKADAYAAWRELVAQAGDVQARRRLVARLRAARQYRPGARVQHRHRDQHRSRHACKEALRRFAAEHNGPYTSTAYERFRKTVVPRDKMPTRMTVVRAFGSWSAALDACELSRDGCRAPETVERVRSSNLARSRASREATREQIAAAIRACRLSVGRWPTAMEFLRWRLRNLPRSPTQGTVYRAFSGGWQEAVAYAQAGLENRKDTGDQDPLTTGR